MTQITNFRNADFDALRNDIDQALAAVGAKYGISFALGSISYNTDLATAKITMSKGAGQDREDVEDAKFAMYFKRYSYLTKDLSLDKIYLIRGEEVQIIGYNPKAKAYPIIARKLKTGERFKYTIETFLTAKTK